MKNKFKPILALLLVAVMALSFVACGNNNDTAVNTGTSNAPADSSAADNPSTNDSNLSTNYSTASTPTTNSSAASTSSKNNSSASTATTNSSTANTSSKNNSSASTSADNTSSKNNSETVQLDKFQQFEKGLSDKQIKFKVVQKMGSMVGAKEGYGYEFNDETSVELYLFDKDSDAYKEASKTNQLTLESFGISMSVVFNDDICIYYNGNVANKADIESIFKSLK